MGISRRRFIRGSIGTGTLVFIGCNPEGGAVLDGGHPGSLDALLLPDLGVDELDLGPDGAPIDMAEADAALEACDDPFLEGTFEETINFIGDQPNFHRPRNQGWDGRLYTDLSLIEDDRIVTPTDQYFIRTFYPDSLDPDDAWSIQIHGLIDTPIDLNLEELMGLVEPMGTYVLECSGNGDGAQFGLMSAAQWDGIPIQAIFDQISIDPTATRVLISGVDDHDVPSSHSRPGASWVFTIDELVAAGAFLATHMNGAPLPLDHGFPVRLYVPNWYGCCCIKWVDQIEFVDDEVLATAQMQEFASRTHQQGIPRMARDYQPASMHQAAMPIRVERWTVDGAPLYRVIGILWGGYEVTHALTVQFGRARPESVEVCPPMDANQPWTVWTHTWRPEREGLYRIRCGIDDQDVPTQRLDTGFYDRAITVSDV